MPKQRGDLEGGWRYASVSLPKEMMIFLDKISRESIRSEPFNDDGVNSTRTTIPSRRVILQDALEMYIRNLHPPLLEEFLQMLKDHRMHQRQDAHSRYIVEEALKKAQLDELSKLKEELETLKKSRALAENNESLKNLKPRRKKSEEEVKSRSVSKPKKSRNLSERKRQA